MSLGKYLKVFTVSWQNSIEYRLDTMIKLVLAAVSLISIFYLWSDVFADKASLMGYTKEHIITYYLLVGYLFASIYAAIPIADEIQQGELSMYLTRPVSYLWYHYWLTLARRCFRLIIGLPILLGLFFVFREHVYIVLDIQSYIFLLITAWMALNILYLIDVLIAFIEFWVFGSQSITIITNTIVTFLAGTMIPLIFLPGYIQTISDFLPFKYTGVFIIESFLGRLSTPEIFLGMAIQGFWTLIVLIIVLVVCKRGLKRYEAVGG